MDLNINVKMDADTTKAIALLAESILSAGTAFSAVESGATSAAAAEPEKPPKRTRKSRAKPAAAAPAVEPPAQKGEETTPAAEPEAPAAPAKITRDTVRRAAGAFLEADGEREKIKAWLEEFGVESITTLDDKHFPEMYERLTA